MKSLLLMLALLQSSDMYNPPLEKTAGVELYPDDPQQNNYTILTNCLQKYVACKVIYAPGTYYLRKMVQIPYGITHAYFAGVTLIPCGPMPALIWLGDPMGPWPATTVHDLIADQSQFKECDDFKPPLNAVMTYNPYHPSK
jgi:hypothetical protein